MIRYQRSKRTWRDRFLNQIQMRVIARKKIKLITINSKVLFCRKQDSIVKDAKSVHSLNHAKKIPNSSSVLFAAKKKAVYIKVNSWFFFSDARTIWKVIPNGNEWKLKAGISSAGKLFLNGYFICYFHFHFSLTYHCGRI